MRFDTYTNTFCYNTTTSRHTSQRVSLVGIATALDLVYKSFRELLRRRRRVVLLCLFDACLA